MVLNIFEAVHYIALTLDEHFTNAPIVYKGTNDTNSFKPSLPTIYEFIVPPEDRNSDGYPTNAPAIALIVTGVNASNDMFQANFEAHIAVTNPSTSEAETATGNNTTRYEFKGGENYTQNATYSDLYAYAMRLGEETLRGLLRSNLVSNLTLIPPEPSLDDFPYATCVVRGVISYRKSLRAVSKDIASLL